MNRFPPGVTPSDLAAAHLRRSSSTRRTPTCWPGCPCAPSRSARRRGPGSCRRAPPRPCSRASPSARFCSTACTEGRRLYVFPPPMAGFFEFAMMRVRADLDQHALAELLHGYVHEEDDFITRLFAGPTKLGRVLVHEPALPGRGPESAGAGRRLARAATAVRRARDAGGKRARPRWAPERDGCRARRPAGARPRAGHRDRAAGAAPRGGPLLLPPQDGPPGPRLRRAAGDVPLARLRRRLAGPSRARPGSWTPRRRRPSSSRRGSWGCCSSPRTCAPAPSSSATAAPAAATPCWPPAAWRSCTPSSRPASCRWSTTLAATAAASACVPAPWSRSRWSTPATRGGPRPSVPSSTPRRASAAALCVRSCRQGALTLDARAGAHAHPREHGPSRRAAGHRARHAGRPDLLISPAWRRSRALAAILGVVLRLPPLKQALASRQLQSRYLERIVDRPRWSF